MSAPQACEVETSLLFVDHAPRSPGIGRSRRDHGRVQQLASNIRGAEVDAQNSPKARSMEMKMFDSRWVIPASPGAKATRRARNQELIRDMAASLPYDAAPLSPHSDHEELKPIKFITRRFDTPGATRLERWRCRVRNAHGPSSSPIAALAPARRRPTAPPGGWGDTRLERWHQRVRHTQTLNPNPKKKTDPQTLNP